MVKVFVRHSSGTESLWAESLGADRYRLANSPFVVYGLSHRDIVIAKSDEEGLLQFVDVSERGGHSTYRLLLSNLISSNQFRLAHWPAFRILGCTFEQAGERLFAIDVPSESDVAAIYHELEAGESKGLWEFEEANFEHTI
jgi:Domain of unknown function (DUF4265)